LVGLPAAHLVQSNVQLRKMLFKPKPMSRPAEFKHFKELKLMPGRRPLESMEERRTHFLSLLRRYHPLAVQEKLLENAEKSLETQLHHEQDVEKHVEQQLSDEDKKLHSEEHQEESLRKQLAAEKAHHATLVAEEHRVHALE